MANRLRRSEAEASRGSEIMTKALIALLSVSTVAFLLLWLFDARCYQETINTPLGEIPCPQAPEAAAPTAPAPAPSPAVTIPTPIAAAPLAADSAPTPNSMQSYAIESKISSIGKFVQLTDDQRERLRYKYLRDGAARKAGTTSDAETLDAILGNQNAEFYRSELSKAFERSKEQEADREVYYLSRRLKLSEQQEARMRELLSTVDRAVKERFDPERAAASIDAGARVKLMIRENEFRDTWLAEKSKEILEPDQYQAYLQEQSDSSAQDLGVWHAE